MSDFRFQMSDLRSQVSGVLVIWKSVRVEARQVKKESNFRASKLFDRHYGNAIFNLIIPA